MPRAGKQRYEAFGAARQMSGIGGFHRELGICALALLRHALDDRRGKVFRTRFDHYSPHAAGSLLLVTTAFEAWLNETIFLLDSFGDVALDQKPDEPIDAKVQRIINRVARGKKASQPDLELLRHVRNEIAHYLPWPRVLPEEGNVPSWLRGLHQRGLLLVAGPPPTDFSLAQKLVAYRLAYWAWETVSASHDGLVEALGPETGTFVEERCVFSAFRQLCRPEQLPEYDARHGLDLTRG